MMIQPRARMQVSRLSCQEVPPQRTVPDLRADARSGLLRRPRSLPPKYFYDARGSRLFEQICRTPEYYPTRTEAALLAAHADEIITRVRPAHVIELGSGSASKTRHLLDACARLKHECVYWPFDVCAEMLLRSGAELVRDYPWLEVRALVGDYNGGLGHLPLPAAGTRLFVFLGGTIGNFVRDAAVGLLAEVAGLMRPGDALLLGADRVKDDLVLRAAYNDAAGVTADFNLNLLRVLNRELGADFDTGQFRHDAVYNGAEQQIEMYLVAETPQRVRFEGLGTEIEFAGGERMLTEISRKFTDDGLGALLAAAGLDGDRHYQPDNGYYSLLLARPVPAG